MRDMTDAPPADRTDSMGPEQGGGPPTLMPWTLVVDGEWEADLEHGAPLPRAGEIIEFIGDQAERRRFRVVDVRHTLQRAASTRPPVRDEHASPNSTVDDGAGAPLALRAGLPRVIVRPEDG
jgi:hypothetical protein